MLSLVSLQGSGRDFHRAGLFSTRRARTAIGQRSRTRFLFGNRFRTRKGLHEAKLARFFAYAAARITGRFSQELESVGRSQTADIALVVPLSNYVMDVIKHTLDAIGGDV